MDIKSRLYIPAFVELEFNKHYYQLIAEHERIVEKVNGSLKATISEYKIKF